MQCIQVAICENGSNGWPSEIACQFEFSVFGENFLRVETTYPQGVKCFTTKHLIIIDDVRIKHIGRKMWIGNRMWNLYQVPYVYALGLIEVLLMSRKWTFASGWSSIHEKWGAFESITGKDLDLDEDYQPLVANANQYEIKFKNNETN